MGFFSNLFGESSEKNNNNSNLVLEEYLSKLKPFDKNVVTKLDSIDPYVFLKQNDFNDLKSFVSLYCHLKSCKDLNQLYNDKRLTDQLSNHSIEEPGYKNVSEYMESFESFLNVLNFDEIISNSWNKGSWTDKFKGNYLEKLYKTDDLQYFHIHNHMYPQPVTNGTRKLSNYKSISQKVLGLEEEYFYDFFKGIIVVTPEEIYTVGGVLGLEKESHNSYLENIQFYSYYNVQGVRGLSFKNTHGIYSYFYRYHWYCIWEKFKTSYFEKSEFDKKVFDLKKKYHEISLESEVYNDDNQLFLRFLTTKKTEVSELFETISLISTNKLPRRRNSEKDPKMLGLEFSEMINNYYELLLFELFNLEYLISIGNLMGEYLKENDDFSFKELKYQIEPLGVYDRTIEKQTYNELVKLNQNLNSINENLERVNKTLISGFKGVISNLNSINNKLWYNNLLTTINTYQLHKISKK
tara:strand:+ start:228 stop:1625 length:1398 start_codon:yes stop_codon:yes gene_type:complete